MKRIIGVDPGLRNTGWAIIELDNSIIKYVNSGVIKTNATSSLQERLYQIHIKLTEVINSFEVTESAIEETFVNMNFGSSLKLAQARAAAMLTLSIKGLSPKEYSARVVKKTIVGNGQAEKEQVMRMLKLTIQGLNEIESYDAFDAVAIAVCHAWNIRF